jgi:hypothetical protein
MLSSTLRMFIGSPLRINFFASLILFYVITGFATIVFGLLFFKYSALMKNAELFEAITHNDTKTIGKYLSDGELIFIRFVFELPGLLLAAFFGLMGATLNYLRAVRATPSAAEPQFLRTELSIGGLMGVLTYVIVQSRTLPKLLHPSISVEAIPDTSMYVLALFCFIAGLFSGDLIEIAERRVRHFAGIGVRRPSRSGGTRGTIKPSRKNN